MVCEIWKVIVPLVYSSVTIIQGDEMKQADLSSQTDGSETTFTVPSAYVSGSLRVYWNGVRQIPSNSFTETTSTTFTTTFTPASTDTLDVDYTEA
jgi:hypothetical protein